MAGADRRPADEFPAITRDPAQREDWRHAQHYGRLDLRRSRGSVTGTGGRICWSRASISRSRRSVTLTSWGGGVGDRNGRRGFVEDEDERRHAEQPALESSQCQSWTCPGSGRGFLLHALYPIGPVEARSPSGCPGRWGGRWCGFRGAMGKNPLPECTHTVSRHVFRVHEA